MTAEVLAILGLGTMGGRAAARAVQQGFEVVGYDPSATARQDASAAGVEVTDDVSHAVASARTILLSVPRPEHVRGLAEGALAAAAPGSVVADLSTIDAQTARAAGKTLGDRQVTYLDAPVLGRPERCGFWTLVVGGPAAAVATVEPILQKSVAARVLRVGDVGAGSVVKLLNNLMFGAINAVTAEVLTIAADNDVDPAVFVDAVAESGAATVSNLFKEAAPRMVAGDYSPVFALDLLAKDNGLALQLADQSGTAAPIAELVDALNRAAADLGLGSWDSGVLHKAYRNLDVRPQR